MVVDKIAFLTKKKEKTEIIISNVGAFANALEIEMLCAYNNTLLGCHHSINKGHFVIFLLIYEYISVIIFTDITNFCGKLYF